jgi:phage shock protein C
MANLSRPRQGRIIAGVCAAIADRFGWDRTLVRVLAVASILLPGPQVILYIVLWALFPNEETRRAGTGSEQIIHPAP